MSDKTIDAEQKLQEKITAIMAKFYVENRARNRVRSAVSK